ncbi:MAG: thiamine phosphate synthase [Acutalibacteraceae bacterium]|nr:thiamine phosphate synthase [Acutalibacteraceae bacterium]
MYKVLCVTNSKICEYDFLSHIEVLAQSNIYGIILREKHLDCKAYFQLAEKVLGIFNKQNKLCILHNYPNVAIQLGCKAIHLPLPVLEESKNIIDSFEILGASVHSVEQAKRAESFGATYVTYGHIFETDCKKGKQPKGVNTINSVADSVNIPVYPLGGINKENIDLIMKQKVAGCAIMGGLMKSGYAEILKLL